MFVRIKYIEFHDQMRFIEILLERRVEWYQIVMQMQPCLFWNLECLGDFSVFIFYLLLIQFSICRRPYNARFFYIRPLSKKKKTQSQNFNSKNSHEYNQLSICMESNNKFSQDFEVLHTRISQTKAVKRAQNNRASTKNLFLC